MGREHLQVGLLGGMVGTAVIGGLFCGSTARAATILNFEDGADGLVNNNYTIGTFGATSGTYADDIDNQGPGVTIADLGTLTSGSTGASLNDYNLINQGLTEAGPISLSFDISIDTTGVTSDSYLQITLIGNGQNGYFQDGYGNLINGYNIKEGLTLGSQAISEGATLTATTPYANGIGTYHFTIPLFAGPTTTAGATTPGYDGNQPTFGNGGAGTTSSYYQFSIVDSGGFGGTATIGLDNVQIGGPVAAVVPEPASFSLVGLAIPALLRRWRRD